ncbi:MAG: hypothetical protein R3C14_21905 [Caldilineaceae bacterium]
MLPLLRPCLLALGLFALLLCATTWSTKPVAAAEGDNLTVTVEGRVVTVESVEAQVNGTTATYTDVLKVIGTEPVTATSVEVFAPPDTPIPVSDVGAVVHGRDITVTHLGQTLADRGRIGIWINGSGWRICIIIVWGSNANLDVTVDGRDVTVDGIEAQLDGRLVTVPQLIAALGPDPVAADKIELFDPAQPDVTKVVTTGVGATLEGNSLKLTGLAREVALRGRIGIWVSGAKWRVCVIIVWGSKTNLDVTVDGREVTIEGAKAELEGQSVELLRLLTALGDEAITADKVEIFDPADESSTQVMTDGVKAMLQGSQLTLTGLTPELAARGRIGIWVSGSNWRICIIIVWGSKANLDVTVDGRTVAVEGAEAQIDSQPVGMRRVLALLGDGSVKADKVEIFDPATPSNTQTLTDVVATVQSNHIALTGLAPELAARGRIGIWISGSRWRICIIIVWGSKANLDVTVDGRDVKVTDVTSEIDGQAAELRRVLAVIGTAPVVADKVEIFKPTSLTSAAVLTDPMPITPTQKVTATIEGSHISFMGLANTLAQYRTIGIWISGRNWRICVIITLGSDNTPRVLVDGRPVIAYQPVAELDGQSVDPRRVLSFLSQQEVTADKIEIEDNGQAVPADGVKAVVKDGQILFTNLADTLAARARLSIWISGSRWRICIIIEWGRFASPDGTVQVDLPATEAHAGVDVTYTGVTTPTHTLPTGKRKLLAFKLDAANDAGGSVTQLDGNYTLVVMYTDEQVAALGIDEESITIYVFDEATGAWVAVPTTVEAANNKATGTLNHFSDFALLGDTGASNAQPTLFLPIIQK